jgi:hypothetical protein
VAYSGQTNLKQKEQQKMDDKKDYRQQVLEQLVDEASFAEVLEDLALVARAKASHILQSYNDKVTAKVWSTYAEWTIKLCDKLTGSQLFKEKQH